MNPIAQKPKPLHVRILSGSVVLLSGSGLATAINFAYNIAVARFLGPKGFGHATAVYTLLTLISAITLSFQIISAKIVAQQTEPRAKSASYRGFHLGAWACGISIAMLLLLFQRSIADYLNLPSSILIAFIAVGAAFYIPLGSRRGYLQGTYGFRRLATNLVLEGALRLSGSLALILLGFGVPGVIAANSAAVALAYFVIIPARAPGVPSPLRFGYALREIAQAVVFYSGQMVINNCDIILVEHFFAAGAAGLYAAVAMVGRVIFSFSQAVVNSMFPLVAGSHEDERKDLRVIATALFLVLGIGSFVALCLRLTPVWIWTTFLGSGFAGSGRYSISYLLALYAITTVIYSLSAVVITFEMSYKIANTSWIQLCFSGLEIMGICAFHASLRQVILVQLVLMTILLAAVALPFLFSALNRPSRRLPTAPFAPLNFVRRVAEDEVISEFLRSDFNNQVFRDYHQSLREIVLQPNLSNPSENAKRRLLFFIRHMSLWNELPPGVEWHEIQMSEANLAQIRVFPRAQWKRIAEDSFGINEIVDCMRRRRHLLDDPFLLKLDAIYQQIASNGPLGPVILIGTSPTEPLTILDGNHRLAAAMLGPVNKVHSLRFLCGLSPRMAECCWHNTNLTTLFRYGKNVIRYAPRRPRAELARLLQNPGPETEEHALANRC